MIFFPIVSNHQWLICFDTLFQTKICTPAPCSLHPFVTENDRLCHNMAHFNSISKFIWALSTLTMQGAHVTPEAGPAGCCTALVNHCTAAEAGPASSCTALLHHCTTAPLHCCRGRARTLLHCTATLLQRQDRHTAALQCTAPCNCYMWYNPWCDCALMDCYYLDWFIMLYDVFSSIEILVNTLNSWINYSAAFFTFNPSAVEKPNRAYIFFIWCEIFLPILPYALLWYKFW